MLEQKAPPSWTAAFRDQGDGATHDARLIELERLVQRAEAAHSLRRSEAVRDQRLTLGESARLFSLYCWGASELARARHGHPGGSRTLYLEGLMRAAYAVVYGPAYRGQRAWGLRRLVLQDFPRLVRAEIRLVLLATVFIALGAGCGALVMHYDPSALSVVVPELHQDQTPAQRIQQEAQRALFDAGSSAVFSSFLFTHNIQVTFLVFALGLSCGLGTAAVLFWNGIPLGALAAQYLASGQGRFFFAWILPHGVIELTVVAVAGASGFVLARGLLRPGGETRRLALEREAKRALPLVLGGMPLLVVAGLVEGTVSQLHPPLLPLWLKLAFALVLALALFAYLGWSGRRVRGGD